VGAGVLVTVIVKLQLPPPVEDITVTVCGEPDTEKNEPDSGFDVTVPQSPDDSMSLAKLTKAPSSLFCCVFAPTVRFSGQANAHVEPVSPAARISTFDVEVLLVGCGSNVVLLMSISLVRIAVGALGLTS